MAITIDGQKVKVLSSLGFNHDINSYVKEVEIDGVKHMAVGTRGSWRLWTPKDRVSDRTIATLTAQLNNTTKVETE